MLIDLRKDAPDQMKSVETETLSEEIEKLLSIQKKIKLLEDQAKDLKEDERHYSCVIIPKIMADQNLESLNLKDGSFLKVKKIIVPH